MGIPIRQTIEDLTPTKIARVMGIPISTVHRWMSEDRIPGKGAAHDWRVAEFEEAAAKVRAANEAKASARPNGAAPAPTPKSPEVVAMPEAPFPGATAKAAA